MTTKEIAERLVALCREGNAETAQRELYATDAINIEPFATAAFAKETKGLDAIIEKGRKFAAMIEQVHSISVSDPLVAGNSFACAMHLDLTIREHGRMSSWEKCGAWSSCLSSSRWPRTSRTGESRSQTRRRGH